MGAIRLREVTVRRPEARIRPHDNWPTEDEALVVRAAVAEGEQAVVHWRAWLSRNDIDRLSFGSFRMLPLVYKNLSSSGYAGPEMPKLKGVYRQSWYRNHLLFDRTAEVVGRLQTIGIPSMLIKGIPLVANVYHDMGTRWMGDADLVVPVDAAGDARSELIRSGWSPIAKDLRFVPQYRPSVGLEAADGLELDLHWYLFKQRLYPQAVDPFWDRAVEFELQGVPTRTLDPTDALLLTLVNGVYWEVETPIRWIPDAVFLLRTHPSNIEWERMLATADRLHLTMIVADALKYLAETFAVPLPDRVLGGLRSRDIGRADRLEHWFRFHTGPDYPWGGLPYSWFQYSRQAEAEGRRASLLGFFPYLSGLWRLDGRSSWEAFRFRSKRLMRRFAAAMRMKSSSMDETKTR